MGSALEIGIRMRNMLTSLSRVCYRFVCCHPCLVCFLGLLIILCRRFPFVTSILVYMSPVLVCTGALLGTLLFLGQFKSAEVQKEKKFIDNISYFQTGFLEGAAIFARRNEYKSIPEERSIKDESLVKDKVNRADQNDGLLCLNVPVVDKNSLIIQHEKQVKEEMEREAHEEKLKAKGSRRNAEAIHEDVEKEESSELGSYDMENSSPDASMVDIIPVLDELHPLLDMEGPQTTHLSRGGSGIEYEKSPRSDDDSVGSDEGTEIPDYEDDEAEESGIDDESKSAIRWTEDDQKNLMDLGSLELERNRRLENIIARRRAWRQMTEKNLIDLGSTEVPSNVPPIVTRRNPFDLPDDSYDDTGIPPIPGSAPSILHPRKNPFDPIEEKPVPKGDSPNKEEFPMFNQKDTFFRRHGSFSLRPSVLRMTKHERQDIYWKPVFVSEQMASEGTGYSSFLGQQSEASDSKLSSVPESASVSSIDQEERMSNEQDLPQEAESISTIDHVSSRVECGSQSSGEVHSPEMISAKGRNVHREEVEIVLGGVKNNSVTELCSETGEAAIHEEFSIGETHLRREVVDEESSSKSSRSSLSEVIEKSASEHQEEKNHLQESKIMTPASAEDSGLQLESSEVEEHQHKEPIYDSSPPAARKLQSFYSIYFDSETDFLERNSPPASAETAANGADEKTELHDHTEHDNTCDNAEDHSASSQTHMEQGDAELHQDLDEKARSITSNCQHVQCEEKILSNSSDKSVAASSINDHNEKKVKFIQHVGTSNNGAGEFYDAMNKFDRSISSLSDDSSATHEFKSPAGGSPKDVKMAEVKLGIPVLEVRSAEDIDLPFKQLQEGANVEEVILPSMIKDQLAREKSEANSEAYSNLKVIEARSLDDINVAFELTSEGNKGKLPKSSDLKDGIVKGEANEVGEFIHVVSSNHEINRIPMDKSENVPAASPIMRKQLKESLKF